MTSAHSLRSGMLAAAVAALVGVSLTTTSARQPARAVEIDADDIGGVVTGTKGTRSRRLGDRRDHRPPDQVRQDRRHRRSGPLCAAGSAQSELSGVGSRIWPGGLAEGRGQPGRRAEPEGRDRANRARRGSVLSGRPLVRADARAEKADFPGTGPTGNGISPNITSQSQWLRNLKSGGCTACHQLGNKATREIPAALGNVPVAGARVGAPHSVGTGRRQHDERAQRSSARIARCCCSPTGPIASIAARCLRRRRGRKGSSATS